MSAIASQELSINNIITENQALKDAIVTLLDSFQHTGPNGEHTCLVFEPMGPSVVARFERSIPYRYGRSISKQYLRALQRLHDAKLVQCDTNPGNLVFSLTRPLRNPSVGGKFVPTRIEGKRDLSAPAHIYEDRPLAEFCDQMNSTALKLCDFGAGTSSIPDRMSAALTQKAFLHDQPPKNPIIPYALRAPELIVQSSFGYGLDIWSFGCYLFEIFTGRPLFVGIHCDFIDESHDEGGDDFFPRISKDEMNDSHLLQMIFALGPLPVSMLERWPRRTRYFDENLTIIRTDVGKSDIPLGPVHVGKTLEQTFRESKPPEMTDEETHDLLYVLRSALKYDPADRPSAASLLDLPWFNKKYRQRDTTQPVGERFGGTECCAAALFR